jgi:hypothetical protein
MAQEITDEETKELFKRSQSGILFKLQWHYHRDVYMYYMYRILFNQFICEITKQSSVKWIKLMTKAFPHLGWLIYMDFNIKNPKEVIDGLASDFLRGLDNAVEKEGI